MAAKALFDEDRPDVGFEEFGTFGRHRAIGQRFGTDSRRGDCEHGGSTYDFLAIEVHWAPWRCGSGTTNGVEANGRRERTSRPAVRSLARRSARSFLQACQAGW